MEKVYKFFWDERYHLISFFIGYLMYGWVR